MKVDRVLQKVMSALHGMGVERQQSLGQKDGKKVVPRKDEVSISGMINYLNQSFAGDDVNTVRMEKVTVLKAQIDSGSYSVSGQAVAQKMLGFFPVAL